VYEYSRDKTGDGDGQTDPDRASSLSQTVVEERLCSTLRILIVLRLLTISVKVRSEIGTTWRIRVSATKERKKLATRTSIMAISASIDCVAFWAVRSMRTACLSWHDDRHRSKLTFISALRIC
jgi:hypothetical protein